VHFASLFYMHLVSGECRPTVVLYRLYLTWLKRCAWCRCRPANASELLVQVGLLDPALLPVAGAEQAKRLLDPTRPANEIIERLRLKAKQQ